jgi:hypothetical protein
MVERILRKTWNGLCCVGMLTSRHGVYIIAGLRWIERSKIVFQQINSKETTARVCKNYAAHFPEDEVNICRTSSVAVADEHHRFVTRMHYKRC